MRDPISDWTSYFQGMGTGILIGGILELALVILWIREVLG